MKEDKDIKVVAVDDSSSILIIIKGMLENRFNLQTFQNPLEFLEKVKDIMPDIITLDMNMPEMNGKEVLKKLKAMKKIKHIPVIMITGESREEDITECYDMGVCDYLVKPFDSKVLKHKIKWNVNNEALIKQWKAEARNLRKFR